MQRELSLFSYLSEGNVGFSILLYSTAVHRTRYDVVVCRDQLSGVFGGELNSGGVSIDSL